MSRCARLRPAMASRKLAHLLLPPSPRGVPVPLKRAGAFGRATSWRFLIIRPAAGAPRRLRQRSSNDLVERYARPRCGRRGGRSGCCDC